MKTVQIEFSKYELVNFLWPELIEDYGFDKARKIVSQAIDLQKMNGIKNSTMPIIFSGTGGLALIPIQMLEKENFEINANLLALTSKGNIKFVRLFDLNTLESNKSKLLEGLFICLQIVLIASAP